MLHQILEELKLGTTTCGQICAMNLIQPTTDIGITRMRRLYVGNWVSQVQCLQEKGDKDQEQENLLFLTTGARKVSLCIMFLVEIPKCSIQNLRVFFYHVRDVDTFSLSR